MGPPEPEAEPSEAAWPVGASAVASLLGTGRIAVMLLLAPGAAVGILGHAPVPPARLSPYAAVFAGAVTALRISCDLCHPDPARRAREPAPTDQPRRQPHGPRAVRFRCMQVGWRTEDVGRSGGGAAAPRVPSAPERAAARRCSAGGGAAPRRAPAPGRRSW